MENWASIKYRDFWDVPRMFLVLFDGQFFLFDCPFDDTLEDYGETYRLYLMPEIKEEELVGSWANLPTKASHYIGEIPVSKIRFDATGRKAIETTVLKDIVGEKLQHK